MAMPIFGVLGVRVNGETLRAKGEWTYSLGGDTLESVVGAAGHLGYKAQFTPAFLEGTITDAADVNLAALRQIRDATLTLHLRNGKTIGFRGAAVVGDPEVSAAEGEISLRFEAAEASEN